MAKLNTDSFFKARVNDLLFYRYRDMMVVRPISGFTKETRMTETRYENCNRSAAEFGRVSALCKQLRIALNGILPKQNNLAVVNSLTKKMREVLEQDTINPGGERTLAIALGTENGKLLLKGYQFNPNTGIDLDYALTHDSLTVTLKDHEYSNVIKNIKFRMHQLMFNFISGENELISGDWVFDDKSVILDVPVLPTTNGVVFTLLETQLNNKEDKSIIIVDI